MKKLNEVLFALLRQNQQYFTDEGELLKNSVYEDAMKMEPTLIKLLLSDEVCKAHFFTEVDGVLVFDKVGFGWVINNRQFLPDSYTRYKNKIGLTNSSGDFISSTDDVVLSFPYKDCILEGGQTKEDQKREETFYNETLAPEEVDRLLYPKVFTGARRYTMNGIENGVTFDENDNLIIKGNNLLAIASLLKNYEGKIKLIYLDPPYNTSNDSFNYNDSFNHSTWLTFIKNRLEIAKRLLSDDGSIYVQLDYNEVHYFKVLMDEIFGRDCFQREIIWDSKYQRKYDNDVDNQLRICETLYYHCWNEPRYISELHTALREVGLDLEGIVTKRYKLKESFKADDLYRTGYVFTNERVLKSRNDVNELLPSVRNRMYEVNFAAGKGGEDVVLEEVSPDNSVKTYQYITTFYAIVSINYSAVNRALRQFDVFKFSTLKSYFPNIKSTYDFVTNKNYLGNIQLKITSKYQTPPMNIIYKACVNALSKIAMKVAAIEEVWEGTTEFKAHYLHELIKDKSVNYTPVAGSKGMSQNDASVGAYRLDLTSEDWFVFNDNYGTSEEKAFVHYFKDYVEDLRSKYDKIYLIRNERQIHIYSFDGGERFEPDYILYLCKNRADSVEQLIIFVEPKGAHLIDVDKWKEDFLLTLKDKAIPTITFVDDNKYKIWGFHFFNTEYRSAEFNADMATI